MRKNNRLMRALLACVLSVAIAVSLCPIPSYAEPPASQLPSVEEAEHLTGISASGEGTDYVAGEVLVVYEQGESESKANKTLEEAVYVAEDSVEEAESVTADIEGGRVVSDTVLDPVVVVKLEPGVSVVQAVAKLSQDPTVKSAQPNYIYTIEEGEGEDLSNYSAGGISSYAVGESGSNTATESETRIVPNDYDSNSVAFDSVSLPEGWAKQTCGQRVSIAILDTGCNYSHPDFNNSSVVACYNALSDASDIHDVTDEQGHGTKVASLACAWTNNGEGIAGSSYDAGLVIVRIANEKGVSTEASMVRGINWVIANKEQYSIRVMNKSMGRYVGIGYAFEDALECQAIQRAKNAGVLAVCSAGNETSSASVPYAHINDFDACLSVIGLSANTSYTSRHTASNYNEVGVTPDSVNRTKDVCAPGSGLTTLDKDGGTIGGRAGTSFAAPIVAGIAALCIAAEPSLTPDDVMQLLKSTADDLGDEGWDQQTGWGRVNASAALEKVAKKSIENASMTLSFTECTYTGNEQRPSATVELDGTMLVEGVDYKLDYAHNIDVGTATVTASGIGKYVGVKTAAFQINAQKVSMHRLYNPYSGEHFYTADDAEKNALISVGWKYEGIGWTAPLQGDPVYRLYNRFGGEHHYTLDATEKNALVNAGWEDEGVGWYSDVNQTVPVYREYNPFAFSNNHNYTPDLNEHNLLVGYGWKDEGVAWYGV